MKIATKKSARGVSHQKTSRNYISVSFGKSESEELKNAAKESGRSVSGFLRYSAMKYIAELKSEK